MNYYEQIKGLLISNEIYKRLGRTTTTIKGKGLISGEKEVMYCVITRVEIFELKRLSISSNSFLSYISLYSMPTRLDFISHYFYDIIPL